MLDQSATLKNMVGKGLLADPNVDSDAKTASSQKKPLDNPNYFINRELELDKV